MGGNCVESKLEKMIKAFIPFNEQEERDQYLLLDSLKQEGVFTRDNRFCHFTASAWVVNERRDKVLMAYHNLYNSWAWLGGHADGNEDLLAVALKEVKEESGLSYVRPVSEGIFSLESLTVDGHIKNGVYVSSHLHLNVTFLIEGKENESLQIKEDENSDVAWFSLEEAVAASNEKWFRENVYTKLNDKLKLID